MSRAVPSPFAVVFFLSLSSVALTACKSKESASSAPAAVAASSAPAAVAPTSTARAAASAAVAKTVPGASFLPALPPAAAAPGATQRVDRPTKEGFAEAVYKKGDLEIATLTVTDTLPLPAIRDDYKGATDAVDGSPLKTSGNFKSAMLVGDRFQVQIASPRLRADQRKELLGKVDRQALTALK